MSHTASAKIKTLRRVCRYQTRTAAGGFLHGWQDLYEKYKKYRFLSLRPFCKGSSVLEIGPAEGDMTKRLLSEFRCVTVLEGSQSFADRLRRRFKKRIAVHEGLIEDVRLDKKFDTIILSHVLEHFDSPGPILRKLKSWLSRDGRLLVMTPNANSLHRHAGVSMGMLKNIYSLNEVDKKIGHKRVYDFPRLERLAHSAGFKITHRGGMLLKAVSNVQMKEYFPPKLIDTFFKLGARFPDIACEIFIVCKHARSRK